MPGLYGASEIQINQYGGGLVLDVDPGELRENQASDAQNVDLYDETISMRRGRKLYNSVAPAASKVLGAHAYYPPDGSQRKVLLAAGTAIYEDNGAGTFTAAVSALTGGAPLDFVGYKDVLYAGNGVDAVRKRDRSGGWSTVTNLAAPGAAPSLSIQQQVIEGFETGTYTLSGTALANSFDNTIYRQGLGDLKLQATGAGASGSYVYKAWAAGATVDLSQADSVILWYWAEKIGLTFQVAVADNTALPGALNFANFPTFTTLQKETWVPIRVPLSAIPPNSRTASTGFGIKWVGKPSSGAPYPVAIYFDSAMPAGFLQPDNYSYYYTYAQYTGGTLTGGQYKGGSLLRESNPSAAAVQQVKDQPPITGVNVAVTASGDASCTHINIYRYRDGGTFRAARLVATVTNTTQTYLDTTDDGQLALNNTAELVSGKLDPPLASTYAIVNNRMLAANVTLSGTVYPYRVYVSQLDFPENFGSQRQTAQTTFDPTVPGWFDLPERDPIVRIVEFDGMAILFCARSIWTLQGSGWDDFVVRKRADVGLDARWAVVVWERWIFFLANDGLRVLAPNRSFTQLFETWRVSEPVDSRFRAIPYGNRKDCALGVDELGRVHCALVRAGQTVSDAALVFDPRRPGALEPVYNPWRPGWTYYTNWGASLFLPLKRGGGDAGQLLAGDPTANAALRYLQRDGTDTDLYTDDGAAIAWAWQSRITDAGPGAKLAFSYLDSQWDAQPNATVTVTPVQDGSQGADTKTLTLPATASGYVVPTHLPRFAPGTRGQRIGVRLSGSHGVPMRARTLSLGVFRRQ